VKHIKYAFSLSERQFGLIIGKPGKSVGIEEKAAKTK
jgi:hypothetical protein